MKWLSWLALGATLLTLPAILRFAKRAGATITFPAVGFYCFVYFCVFSFLLGVPNFNLLFVAGLFSVIQVAAWSHVRGESLSSPRPYQQTAVLIFGWISTYYYFGWTYNISTQGRAALVMFLFAVVVVFIYLPWTSHTLGKLSRSQELSSHRNVAITRVISAIAVIVLAIEPFRTDRIDPINFMHHWGVYVGDLQQIQTGGWLLWDTPSQYGFLSILFLKLLPFATAWSRLYIANALFVALEGIFLYFFIKKIWPGFWGAFISFALTFSSMHFVAGWLENGSGVMSFPSVSGFRFLWVICTVILLHHRHGQPSSRFDKNLRTFEPLIFIVSMLWAPESFFYCSLIWASYYWGQFLAGQPRIQIAQEILKKVITLVSAVLIIAIFYRINLRHFPDFFMFFEYAVSFGSGFGSLPMLFPGPGLAYLYFLFVALLILILWFDVLKDQLGLFCASLTALWACGTYYLARSHPNNATNLLPLLIFSAAALIRILNDTPAAKSQLMLWLLPLGAGLILTMTLNRPLATQYLINLPHASFFNIESKVPTVNEDVRTLLMKIPDAANARITSWHDDNLLGRDQDNFLAHTWLPLSPMTLHYPIREKRKNLYVRRRLMRSSGCGWIFNGARYPRSENPMLGFEHVLNEFGWKPRQTFQQRDTELVEWCKGDAN